MMPKHQLKLYNYVWKREFADEAIKSGTMLKGKYGLCDHDITHCECVDRAVPEGHTLC
jgi:hypothetical protein